MAIPSAAGYTNLPNGGFSPTIFSKQVLLQLRKKSVAEGVTTTQYAGEITDYGSSVQILKEPDITIRDYAKGQQVTAQDLQDDTVTLTVDSAKMFAFTIDDIEAKQSLVGWSELASNKAAYRLKDSFDQAILAKMAAGAVSSGTLGTNASPIVVNNSGGAFSPLDIIGRASRLLDEQSVPEDERFFIAPPHFWEMMTAAGSPITQVYVTGDDESPLRNGQITDKEIRGFKLYKSLNLPKAGSGSDAAGSGNCGTLIAGHMSSTTTVQQLAKLEVLRNPNSFGQIVRGLHVYGSLVLRPEALVTVKWNKGA